MEDYILFAGVDCENNILQPEQCQRLFSLEGEVAALNDHLSTEMSELFSQVYSNQYAAIADENSKRNHTFFDEEVDKLEKWSDDVRNSIKFEIKELDKEIKTRKTEARKLLNLEQKIKEQRIIKDLEKKLADKRFFQYQHEDDIEARKDNLLDEIEKRLKQKTTEQELFTIRWKVI